MGYYFIHAGMAELADALDLGSSILYVQVQVLLPAPNRNNPNQIFLIGDGFGLFVFLQSFIVRMKQHGKVY